LNSANDQIADRDDPPENIRVIIYGTHTHDWMSALGTGAPVWRALPEVVEVVVVPDAPDAVIPAESPRGPTNVVIPLLETHAKNIPKGARAFVSTPAIIELLANKIRFAEYASRSAFQRLFPKSYYYFSEEIAYPCVLKRADLHAGVGIMVVNSRSVLLEALKHPVWFGQKILIQSFVEGRVEYVMHAVCRDGYILWHCAFAYEMQDSDPIRRPKSKMSLHHIELKDEIFGKIQSITRSIGCSGPINVNYKIVGEEPIIFEINPRLGGSLMLQENVRFLAQALSTIISGTSR
jgi:carbamoylphosphate synthase large subunit